MEIAIAGAGAMGSRFGYMLQKAGNQVTFIDEWKEHIDKINRDGLLVETESSKEYCQIPAVFPTEAAGKFDLIILFTKAMQLEDMLQKINHLLYKDTAILCLANGLGNLEIIEKYSGDSAIYIGVTLWSSELEAAGHIRATGSGSIELQPINETSKERTLELLATLNLAGLNADLSEDVLLSIWKKAAFNSVLNTYCAILDCNVGEFGASPQAMILTEKVVAEFVQVAEKVGVPLTADSVLETVRNVFSPEESGHHYPSMHQDLAKGRKTEVDYLNGAVAKIGAKAGVNTPVNSLLTAIIHAQEDIKGL
ncbi:oxidoreductase [Enterococcus sp. 669A]|uniref:2-dehydropantoate 2-reductase n=1 Tax=Candidatus Enterococcus moelleringii TaxID=2815325 RepID=A0ABS3L9L7_9ENTE|nr:oxidoreductase [Enterococcus sp. 669A]MBO1306290.1 oxidoreductase [Enterococcus sp. 669A]